MNNRHFLTLISLFFVGAVLLPVVASGQDINKVRQVRLEKEDTKTVIVIPGTRVVNFTAFAVESPPSVVLELASTLFEETVAPMSADDWTVSSLTLANQGTGQVPKARLTVFLARKATYRVESSGNTVRLVLTPHTPPPLVADQAQLERLQQQAAEMQKRIQEAEARAEQLRRESEQIRKDGKDAREANAKLTREREAIRQNLQKLTADREIVLARMKELENQLAKAKTEQETARRRVAELEAHVREVQQHQAESKAELEKTTLRLQNELAQRKAIEQEIQQAKAEIARLKSLKNQGKNHQQKEQLQAKLTKLEREVALSDKKLQTIKNLVLELEARRTQLSQQVAAEEEKLKMLRANAELENRKLNAELNELRTQAKTLQQEKEKLLAENSKLLSQREVLRQSVENERKLQISLEEARKKNAELQQKAAELAKREQEKAREIETRRQSLETLLAREKEELARIQESKMREQETLNKLKDARTEHQRLLIEEERSRQELEKTGRQNELEKLKQRQKERERKIAQLEEQITKWERSARESESKAKSLSSKLERARKELEEARTQYDVASQELIQVTQARDEIRGQLREMKAQLEGIARQKAVQLKQLEEITGKLAQSERKLRETERKFEENRKALAKLEQEQTNKERQVQALSVSARQLAEQVRQDREVLQEMNVRKTRIQEELKQLETRRRDLESNLQKTKSQRGDIQEVERRAAELKELEQRRARLEKDLAQLEQAHEALRKVEIEKVQAQSELADLERKKLEVSRQLDEMNRQKTAKTLNRKEIEARQAEIQQLEERRRTLEKELTTLAERKVQLQAATMPVASTNPKQENNKTTPDSLEVTVSTIENVEFRDSPWSHHLGLLFDAAPRKETIEKNGNVWKVTFPMARFKPELRQNMDTSSYNGPVHRVLTFNRTDQAVVEIHTNGPRTVQVRRTKTGILILIPKTVAEVRRFQKSQTAATEVGGYDVKQPMASNLPTAPNNKPASRKNVRTVAASDAYSRRGGYSGRFVDLDFKDADLHNVIRLVAEVWGKNVVIPDDIKGTITIKLTNVRVDRAFDVILKSKNLDWVDEGGNIIRIATVEQLTKEREDQLARTKTEVKMIPTETRLIPINYANVEDIAKTIETNVMSSRGKVTFDKRTNVIIYVDVPAKIKVAYELVRSLDLPTPQVQIEARIVEAETTFLREIGVQWGGSLLANAASGNPTGLIFPSNIGIAGGNMDQLTKTSGINAAGAANPDFAVNLPANTGAGSGGAIGMTLGSLSGAVNINLRLSAMEEIGHVRSIAAPKVTTLDNVEAKITQGVEIPYPQSSAQGNTVIMKQAVLSLSVTPHVTNDNMVQMKIEVTKDEPDLTNRGADGSLGISKKSAKTELLVRSGDTAVIGGIYKRQSSLIYRKVPWFADIPIVGWLFKSQYKKDSRSELLIFITPRVLNRSGIIVKE